MNKTDYSKIKEIADEAWGKHETITRADVAYLLNCADGADLSAAIYQAYLDYNHSESIRWAILTNQEYKSVVDSYELNQMIEQNPLEALSSVGKDMKTTQTAIADAHESISDVLTLKLAQDVASLAKTLQASGGIDTVRAKASALMQNYGKMVDDYQNAELCVKNDIHDFVQLRTAVNSQFMQYASALVDIFGDSIKVIAPSLFDFDQVKWLDVTAMQNQTKLDYTQLDEKCTMLVGEVAQHFDQTLNQLPVWMKTSKALGSKGGIYGALVMGVLSYLNHIVDAGEKTTRMQHEYVALEESVKRDRFLINSDMLRLAAIHKTVNDLYIPRADAFARLAGRVLSDDLKQLLDSLYTGKARELRDERDALLQRCRQLEYSINDHQENVSVFESRLQNWQGQLDAQKENYTKATQDKPSSPNILSKIFTLGFSQRKYEENYLVWSEANEAFVSAYEDTMADVHEGTADCQKHKEMLESDQKEYAKCRAQLEALNQQIASMLNAQPEQKVSVLKHLKSMVGLLRAGKSVVESRLDDSMLQPVAAPKLEDHVKLPFDVEEKVTNFTKRFVEEAEKNGASISHSMLQDLGLESDAEATTMTNHVVQQGARLLDSWTRLQAEEIRSKLSEAVYQQELAKLKSQFQATMQQIDQQSGELREMLQLANTSVGDNETVRKALMEMAGIPEEQLSESDFEAILKNQKSITI